jgi:acyl-CoA dehydrogenase
MMDALPFTVTIPSLILMLVVCAYFGVPLWVWSLYGIGIMMALHPPIAFWVIFGILILVLNLPWLRRHLLTAPLMRAIQALHLLPKISDTERVAIDAGTVWVEGEFFSGVPNWQRLTTQPYGAMTPETQAFLDGPVEQVCRMATDWEIHQRKDLPPAVWTYLKQERFLGMMIPEAYGGLGFSTAAYSAVMVKLASRSFIHTATVGVTNSLGPAKLLLNYGTPAQKDYYLPRLARGEEMPCFALTEPEAGSDAASITADGVVFKGEDGQLYLRLNFQKRYITLGTIATLIALAFKLRDPDHLLGSETQVGITVALIPAQTPGVLLGKRHDPMGVPFYNSPIVGRDVVVAIDQIIGGVAQAGQGWKMLMQSLAAGRGISFPASCTGVAKLVARTVGAYAVVRRQFGLSIGRFAGVEEPLARIGGLTYLLEAARVYTCGAVDQGEKPAVVSAIAKYQFTELTRQITLDGMDVLGGSGICRGPRNLLANLYTAMPIPITVEGSNIITRSLMIFGQGVIRCHPYLYSEIAALQHNDVVALDRVLWSHLGALVRNGCRSLLLSLTRGYLAGVPGDRVTAPYYRKLAWASATFAWLTDLALLSFGGSLKRQEKLTGRFADILSWLYLGTATLRRFTAEGSPAADLPYLHWAMHYAFAQIQAAFVGLFANWSTPILGPVLRLIVAAWWRINPIGTPPDDQRGHQVAQALQTGGSDRDRLTAHIYLPTDPEEALGRLEEAFRLSSQVEQMLKTIKAARPTDHPAAAKPEQLIAAAVIAGIITSAEAQLLKVAEAARQDAIQVDAFTLEEYQGRQSSPPPLAAPPDLAQLLPH